MIDTIRPHRTIWVSQEDPKVIEYIDQRPLPHQLVIGQMHTVNDAVYAIKAMAVRGAPLIGITAAYGVYLACLHAPQEKDAWNQYMAHAIDDLKNTRPTAVNLHWTLNQMGALIAEKGQSEDIAQLALAKANALAEDDIETCYNIGVHGLQMLEDAIAKKNPGDRLNILTHCNAGWLGCVDWGTATAPIYLAHEKGLPVHVWVDETRPRNQGFNLTAWEMRERGVPHTVIVDNTGGHLMQHGMVDLVIVGTDRTTRTGDVANKIGTYLKALAAKDNNIPFYVALPGSTIDWSMTDGIKEIPIEERDPNEVKYIQGFFEGKLQTVQLTPDDSPAANYGFDVTPARLVTALITERGVCEANEVGLRGLYPEVV